MLLKLWLSLLLNLPRKIKKLIVLMLDISMAMVATWLAFCLRFDNFIELSMPIIQATIISAFLFIPVFISQGLYRAIFRYAGWFALISLIRALVIYGAIYIVAFTIIGLDGVPRSIGFIQPVLLFMLTGSSRQLAIIILRLNEVNKKVNGIGAAVLIYGAGSAGRQLASGLRQTSELQVVGFIDDDTKYTDSTVSGLRVYLPGDIPRLLESNLGITDVLLAMPSVSRARQREILLQLSNMPVRVRILPGLVHLANGDVKVQDVREVEIEDILGREPVSPNKELLKKNIAGKIVMVSGAGGSIGSELCRQILAKAPKILILFELSEFALYSIDRELSQQNADVQIIPILGSVQDLDQLLRIIRRFCVQTFYHAAAYKHVPMIEMNPVAGVLNNVFGTSRALKSAIQGGVETFVLISTDKAVRPTNIMGCTKRIAEIVLQAESLRLKQSSKQFTKLTIVRFGNVLGSSGSVVHAFREQIMKGGPVTVTHPEMIRYFMTIPEAAQLVIQAGAMGKGGDVMVLDMGHPVKIFDLAKKMIHLSGFSHKTELNTEGDVQIVFTGLRPGEKLYEELLINNNVFQTSNPRIMRADEQGIDYQELEPMLVELEVATKNADSSQIRSLLKKIVPEFNPQSDNRDVLVADP